MKKIIISLLAIIIAVNTYGQETILETYKNMTGRKNVYTDKMVFENPKYSNITFYVGPNYARTDDEANSIYRATSQKFTADEPTYKSTSWECLDENNRKCVFTFMIHKEGNVRTINIIYDYIVYVYYIK